MKDSIAVNRVFQLASVNPERISAERISAVFSCASSIEISASVHSSNAEPPPPPAPPPPLLPFPGAVRK